MSTPPAPRVFSSYAGSDAPATEPLVCALRAAGLEVFRDRDTLVPGQFWPERLEQALGMADTVVVCLGPAGLGPWQKRETALALERQSRDDGFPVIPLLLPGADDSPLGFLRLLSVIQGCHSASRATRWQLRQWTAAPLSGP